MKRLLSGLIFSAIVVASGVYEAQARPQYATKESKPCSYCHVDARGGGPRNFRGGFYGANDLSFDNFDEAREAALARVELNSMGDSSVSKVGYITNVSGPASKQITARSNRSPVLVVFLNTAASDNAKAALKILGKVADALGRNVAVVGVVKADTEAALKLTTDLGNQIRILPDTDGAAAAKYQATQGLDMVLVPKFDANDPQQPILYSGFSKTNLDAAILKLSDLGYKAEGLDTSKVPATAVHGEKIGG